MDNLIVIGVSVEIPDEQTDSSTVTLRGDPGKLGQALSLVYAKASSVVSDHVECPAWLHKHVIGPKGANIRRIIGEEAKVSVDFDDENFIYIEGSPEEVKRAKAELVTLTQQLQVIHLDFFFLLVLNFFYFRVFFYVFFF